jgi:hypothetical protein
VLRTGRPGRIALALVNVPFPDSAPECRRYAAVPIKKQPAPGEADIIIILEIVFELDSEVNYPV